MVTTTLTLILAHFLADFLFQPRCLVNYKLTHFGGVLLHGFIHLVTYALILFPFWNEPRVFWAILFIAALHVLVDQVRIQLNRRPTTNLWISYVLDQVIHLTVIVLVSVYYIGSIAGSYPVDSTVISYALAALLSTYFFDITRWVYQSSKSPRPYTRDYKMMAKNFTIVTIAFVLYWVMR